MIYNIDGKSYLYSMNDGMYNLYSKSMTLGEWYLTTIFYVL